MKALDKRNFWVIIILYNITEKELVIVKDPQLRIYLKNNTYIKWGEPRFWNKLKKALKKKDKTSLHNNDQIHTGSNDGHNNFYILPKINVDSNNVEDYV